MQNAQLFIRPGCIAAIAFAGLLFPAQAQAPLDIRVALVIGNSAYASAPLLNPSNDAHAMGDTLRGLGFAVTELRDAERGQMTDAIRKVRDSLQGKQGVGMLYFAGHGLQLDWHNYMVPVDAKLASVSDVAPQTVDINSVIDAFKSAGNRMNIVVLDACRDNPFPATASGKGLAPLDAPPGTFLAYATAPGNVAEDGDATSGNGLYTQFLLQELKKPTAKIEDVFKRVRLNVRKQSQGRQVPWESTSLEDDFYFNRGQLVAEPKPDERAKEAAFSLEKADWDQIRDSRNADDFYAFLQKHPNGNISELAQAQLERLQKARVVAVANKDGIVQTPGASRFRLGDAYEYVVRNGYTGAEMQRLRGRVTSVEPDKVIVNNGVLVLTPEGGTIRNTDVVNMDPPRLDLPAGEYIVGKKWSFRSIQTGSSGTKFWVEGQAKIVSLETITVPAGTFKTYKVELTTVNELGARVRLTRWMEPDWGFSIKLVREIRPRSGQPTLDSAELVSRQRGNG